MNTHQPTNPTAERIATVQVTRLQAHSIIMAKIRDLLRLEDEIEELEVAMHRLDAKKCTYTLLKQEIEDLQRATYP